MILLAALVFWLVSVFNGLVLLRNRYRNAFAQIDVQLKRRHDLIPNLIETAKGFMAHERATFEAVVQARNRAVQAGAAASAQPGDANAMQALVQAESALGGTLGRLFALSEAYPELKSDQNMLGLQEELGSTENRIAFARQAFNDEVTAYNTRREVFPDRLFTGVFGFEAANLMTATESADERQPVKVSF
jgi:LemA protein